VPNFVPKQFILHLLFTTHSLLFFAMRYYESIY